MCLWFLLNCSLKVVVFAGKEEHYISMCMINLSNETSLLSEVNFKTDCFWWGVHVLKIRDKDTLSWHMQRSYTWFHRNESKKNHTSQNVNHPSIFTFNFGIIFHDSCSCFKITISPNGINLNFAVIAFMQLFFFSSCLEPPFWYNNITSAFISNFHALKVAHSDLLSNCSNNLTIYVLMFAYLLMCDGF